MDSPFPTTYLSVPNTYLGIGIPATMLYPLSAITCKPIHRKAFAIEAVALLPLKYGLLQRWRQFFVGIYRKYPIVGSYIVGIIFLLGISKPLLFNKTQIVIFVTYCLRFVGRQRIHHHYFVGNRHHRIQTSFYILFFV